MKKATGETRGEKICRIVAESNRTMAVPRSVWVYWAMLLTLPPNFLRH